MSLKNGRGSHAWILTSGAIEDIEDPEMHIYGSSPVDDHTFHMSSGREKLTGITALSIASKILQTYYSTKTRVTAICDSQSVISKCSTIRFTNIRRHHEANIDWYLNYKQLTLSHPITLNWILGHANTSPRKSVADLSAQKLSRDEIFNIWCDHLALEEWQFGSTPIKDPDVSPAERWSLYSKHQTYRKITGDITDGIYSTMGYTNLAEYISKKHNLAYAWLDRTNTAAFKQFISGLKITQCSSIIKLLHNWEPTNSHLCRQGRESSLMCPRCKASIKTSDHYRTCSDTTAMEMRQKFLREFLLELECLK